MWNPPSFHWEAIASDLINLDIKPLTYNYYREVMKGFSPKMPLPMLKSRKSKVKFCKRYLKMSCGNVSFVITPTNLRRATPFRG